MGRKYADPPIVEAVCEFRLPADSDWDLAIPGLVYEQIRDRFPRREQRTIQEVEIVGQKDGFRQEMRANERAVFLTEDKTKFIQVGRHLWAINCLKPYPTWRQFEPVIRQGFEALTDVVKVTSLQRIGLRYINRVEIPHPLVDLEQYFSFRPYIGPELPEDFGNFVVGCIFVFAEGRDACRAQLRDAVPEDPDSSAFILDLDYYLARPQAVPTNEALSWVEDAHSHVEQVFEGCITDRLRQTFGEA